MSRGMSVRTNFPLALSSPPTRATHDSVSALIPSGPPSRSYSDFDCVVICFPLPRLVRPSFCPYHPARQLARVQERRRTCADGVEILLAGPGQGLPTVILVIGTLGLRSPGGSAW